MNQVLPRLSQNALRINTAPLDRGLEAMGTGIRRRREENALREIGQQAAISPQAGADAAYKTGRLGVGAQFQGLADRRARAAAQAEEEKQNQIKLRFSQLALLVSQERDPVIRAQKHERLLALHPNAANLPAEIRDPELGPMLMLAEGGQAGELLKLRQQQARQANDDARLGLERERVSIARQNASRQATAKREIRTDAAGVPRFVDSGDKVFEGDAKELSPLKQLQVEQGMRLGLSPDQALAFAAGQIVWQNDPLTKRRRLIDTSGREIIPAGTRQPPIQQGVQPEGDGSLVPAAAPATERLDLPNAPLEQLQPQTPDTERLNKPMQFRQSAVAEQPAERKGLFERAAQATGLLNRLGNTVSGITEQGGVRLVDRDVQQAISDFDTAQNSLARAYTLNPKFPVAEVDRVRALLSPGVKTSPGQLRIKMISLANELERSIPIDEARFRDDSLPLDARRDAERRVAAAKSFLQKLQVPPLITDNDEAAYKALPPGSLFRLEDGSIGTKR